MRAFIRREWALLPVAVTVGLFLAFGLTWFSYLESRPWFAFISLWLLAATVVGSFAALRHAEAIAERLGEPLGTLVLTLAITAIEVTLIAAVMYSGEGNEALARDAMFAVIMIVLNGMVGLSLLAGALRHHEQTYNLQGANTFLAVIVPLSVLDLVLPNYTQTTPGPILSLLQSSFLIVISLALYGVFLAIQNLRHRDYFVHETNPDAAPRAQLPVGSWPAHAVLLVAYLVGVLLLAHEMALPINHGIHVLGAPAALGGLLVSLIVLSPESLGAVRAAQANQLQRAVNLLLGSVLASISLTVPTVLVIGFLTGQAIVLGLNAVDTILLVLTLVVSMLTFASARTNVLLGAVHLVLFLAYVMLIFES